MTSFAIRATGVGKDYPLRRARARYQTLRESLVDLVRRPLRRSAVREDRFWALRDVSFDVRSGDVVGVIGKNGAGKSTLLKLLGRITEPSRGQIELRGRVGSLLEVGTGFHHELSGRENIFLNGAIMGMRRQEVRRKLDAIVEFSGVAEFIDMPVKHYSSGMYMRLAFSVAAHLEPEILLVDEVLAVGDIEFQRRSLGKMQEVARSGRTVVFVSHQLNAVKSLCNRGVVLEQGCLAFEGPVDEAIGRYMRHAADRAEWTTADQPNAFHNPHFTPTRLAVVGANLRPIDHEAQGDEPLSVLIEGDIEVPDPALTVGFAVSTTAGDLLYWSYHTDTHPDVWPALRVGRNRLVCRLPARFLNEGDYRIELISSLHFREWITQSGVNAPTVALSVRGGLSDSPYWMMARPGLLAPVLPFRGLEETTR